ncbi:putative mucin/carbohydrate-binding domain-containing protein, partial [Yersinia pestis]
GTNQSLSKNDFPLSSCYVIDIFHKEPGRVKLTPAYKGVIDNKSSYNEFIITPYGLQNIKLNNDPKVFLLENIKSAAEMLRSHPIMWHANFSEAKDNIYLAIDIFPSPQKEGLLEQYADCISSYYEKPNEDLGNAFSFIFKGINDREFLTTKLNLVTKKLEVKIVSGTPHSGFKRTYAVLRYFNADGNELLNLDIIGSKKQAGQEWVFPISGYGGEKLYLQHVEPKNRLVITNIMQGIRLSSRTSIQTYEIESLGLSRCT